MSNIKRLMGLFLLFGSFTAAAADNLIPAELFTKPAQFQQMRISPTGEYIAASLLTENGESRVVVIELASMKMISMAKFREDQQPAAISWLNDERIGFSLLKTLGGFDYPMDSGDYFAMNADGSKKKLIWTFVEQNYSRMQILSTLPDDPDKILIAQRKFSSSKGAETRAAKLDIYSGRVTRLATAPIRDASLLADAQGNIRFASGIDADANNAIKLFYRANADADWDLLDTYNERKGSLQPIAFTEDGNSVYALSDLDATTQGLIKYNLKDKSHELIYRNDRVNPDSMVFGANRELVGIKISPDTTFTVPVGDTKEGKWLAKLQSTFASKIVDISSRTRDQSKMIIVVSSASQAPAFYLFDANAVKITPIATAMPWLDKYQMAKVEPFEMTARDGVKMYGYLTLPVGKDAKNLPLIVHPHGGPHGPRDYWAYDPTVQFLANRGYAVLQLNFRGSGGYGRDFMYSGYGKWGAEMQDDLTDATHWAIDQGIADKNRVCIFGASYGGYAALMGVVKEPDLYKCAVGYAGVYSLPMLFEEGDVPDSKFGRNYLKSALGTDAQVLKDRSPALNVDKIKAGLFIVHGGKDQRASIKHAYLLRDELDKINYPYEWLLKENEAHGFSDADNRTELLNRLEQFFGKYIGEK